MKKLALVGGISCFISAVGVSPETSVAHEPKSGVNIIVNGAGAVVNVYQAALPKDKGCESEALVSVERLNSEQDVKLAPRVLAPIIQDEPEWHSKIVDGIIKSLLRKAGKPTRKADVKAAERLIIGDVNEFIEENRAYLNENGFPGRGHTYSSITSFSAFEAKVLPKLR